MKFLIHEVKNIIMTGILSKSLKLFSICAVNIFNKRGGRMFVTPKCQSVRNRIKEDNIIIAHPEYYMPFF